MCLFSRDPKQGKSEHSIYGDHLSLFGDGRLHLFCGCGSLLQVQTNTENIRM